MSTKTKSIQKKAAQPNASHSEQRMARQPGCDACEGWRYVTRWNLKKRTESVVPCVECNPDGDAPVGEGRFA